MLRYFMCLLGLTLTCCVLGEDTDLSNLLKKLGAGDATVRVQALSELLTHSEFEKAIPQLLDSICDKDAKVAALAEQALLKLGKKGYFASDSRDSCSVAR